MSFALVRCMDRPVRFRWAVFLQAPHLPTKYELADCGLLFSAMQMRGRCALVFCCLRDGARNYYAGEAAVLFVHRLY